MRIVNVLGLLFFLASCKSPLHLPIYNQQHLHPYGAEIKLENNQKTVVKGEFLCIDDSVVWVLIDMPESELVIADAEYIQTNVLFKKGKNIYGMPMRDIYKYQITCARTKFNYRNAIWMSMLSVQFHGVFMFLTLPINLIMTSAVSKGGRNAYRFTEEDGTLFQLKHFSRFPAGLPTEINLNELSNSIYHPPPKPEKSKRGKSML